jgi:hypothetical protein
MPDEMELVKGGEAQIVGFDQTFIELIKQIGKLTNRIINKPTTKEKIFPSTFVINKDHIKDIYDTIERKVSDYKVDEKDFTIGVLYNDKSYVPFPTYESFMEDHETKPICAKSIKLKWSMKIFFEGRHNPLVAKIGEEHKVEITFSVAPDEAIEAEHAFFMFNGYPVESRGVIQVAVMHSNKVWADEVIQHVQDYVERIKIPDASDKSFFQKRRKIIAKSIEALISLSSLVPLFFIFFDFNDALQSIKKIAQYGTLCCFLFIIGQLFAFSIGKRIFTILGKAKMNSWIILNKFTEKKYDLEKNKQKNGLLLFLYFILPVCINIISAYICWKIGIGASS